MNPIESLLSEPFGQALGWTLLHFVWQGALVALLLALALYLLRRQTAQVRYVVACGAMLLMLALPALTLFLLWPDPVATPVDHLAAAVTPAPAPEATPDTGAAALATPATQGQGAASWLAAALPWLVLVWMAGVLTLSVGYAAGWTYTIRLRRRGAREVGQRWQDQLARLKQQMGVRRAVRLVSSALVQVPSVAGWLRPVILVPVSVFTGLSPRQIEMVIAHELAHIRRHDYLVNLLQAACETVLFYHPAVWWVSQRIRIEREHCCDDLVVSVCGDAFTYAAALAKLETVRQTTPRLALAASGGSLLDRVRRLLEGPAEASPRAARWFAGLIVLGAVLLSLVLSSAFDGVWDKTHAWIAGTETNALVSEDEVASGEVGVIMIHSNYKHGITSEEYHDSNLYRVEVIKAPYFEFTIPKGASLHIDNDEKPESGQLDSEAHTITFQGNLTVEVWHNEERLRRLTVREATVIYAMPDGSWMTEQNMQRLNQQRQRLLKPNNGYERTADLLEKFIFEDRSVMAQLEAIDELRALPKRASLRSLANVAERHSRRQVRLEAVQWLGRLGDAYVVFTVERIAFEDGNAAVQMEALDALRNLPEKIGMPSLIKIAQTHPRPAMRREATQWLGRLADEAARVTFVQIIYNDPDPGVQNEAFDALLNLPNGLDLPLILKISQDHPNSSIRRRAFEQRMKWQLDQTRSKRGLDAWRKFLNNANQQAHQSTAKRLETLVFKDESEETQLEAVKVLANEPGEAALPSLKKIAWTHPNEAVRERAARYATEVEVKVKAAQEEEEMWAQAIEDLKHDDVSQRIIAVKTLEDLPTKNVFNVLSDVVFNDPSVEVQMEALDALRDKGGSNFGPMALIARIIRNHPNPAIRVEAVQSIDNMKADDRLPLLEEVIFRDGDLPVRTEALERLIDAPETAAMPILARITRRYTLPESIRHQAAEAIEDRLQLYRE